MKGITMNPNQNNRREFLKAGGAALAATAVSWNAKSYAQIAGANDRVRVGIVGCGDRMKQGDLPAFQQSAQELNFQIVAVSDIWNRRRDEGAAFIEKLCGNRPDTVRNNDELYARKDVDAVIIATADFQHAYHGAEAVRAGRDAYVEKPTAHTMADARMILDAVKKSGKIVQVGTQRRSTPAYQKAAEYIKSGQFGDIVMVEMSWNVNQPGRWRRPDVVPLLKEEDTDWKRYLLNRTPAGLSRSMPASILSSVCSGRIRREFPISGWFTRSTPSTGSPGCRILARAWPTAASICGKTAALTGTR